MKPRQIDRPEPGFWMLKLVKGGPEVPACIFRFGDQLTASINGETCAVDEVWLRKGREITRQEHHDRLMDYRWLKENKPNDPRVNPEKPVDLSTLPIPFSDGG